MKIKVTYQTPEELKKALSCSLQSFIDAGAKTRQSDKYAPYLHFYIEIPPSRIDRKP